MYVIIFVTKRVVNQLLQFSLDINLCLIHVNYIYKIEIFFLDPTRGHDLTRFDWRLSVFLIHPKWQRNSEKFCVTNNSLLSSL
jgi:hypothetical protein